MGLVFLITFVWSVVHVFRTIKLYRQDSFAPNKLHLFTIIIVLFVPFTEIVLDLDFKWNYPERQTVVSMVERGELKPNVYYNSSLITLPPGIDTSPKAKDR